MDIVRFPSFNLELNISKIAFIIFGIKIYKYAICIIIGIVLGLIIAKINSKKSSIKFDEVLEKSIFTIIIGIIGARLYFILFNYNYYKDNLISIINLRDGGLAIYGGLLFGALYIFFRYYKEKEKMLEIFDILVPSVAIAQCVGRWGNFFNIEAYVYETSAFFRMGIFEGQNYIEVHPCFLYESFFTFVIFLILEILISRKKYNGQIFLTYCLLYSGLRAIIEYYRADSLMIGTFKVSMILSIVIFLVSLTIIVIMSRKMSYEKQGKY